MQKKISWEHVAHFFVAGRAFYCASEKVLLQIICSWNTSTTMANPENLRESRPFLSDDRRHAAPIAATPANRYPCKDAKNALIDTYPKPHALFMRALSTVPRGTDPKIRSGESDWPLCSPMTRQGPAPRNRRHSTASRYRQQQTFSLRVNRSS